MYIQEYYVYIPGDHVIHDSSCRRIDKLHATGGSLLAAKDPRIDPFLNDHEVESGTVTLRKVPRKHFLLLAHFGITQICRYNKSIRAIWNRRFDPFSTTFTWARGSVHMFECAEELSDLVILGHVHLAITDSVPEDDNVGWKSRIDFPVLDQGVHEGHLQCIHNFLTLSLDGNSGIISAHVIIDRGNDASDRARPPALVVENVDPHDHDVFVGRLTRPQLPSQFAVDLKGDLLRNGTQPLLVVNRFNDDHLARDGFLDAAEFLDA